MVEFENPGAFLLLLLIPILYILRHIGILSRITFPLNLSDWNGENFSWNGKLRKAFSAFVHVLCIAFYVCLVIACASPVYHQQQKVYSSRGASIIFVVDVSPSMAARDIGDLHRLDAAKQAISTLASHNDGSEFGLVEMAETACLLIPPTMDRKIFFDRLDGMNIGELGDGTAIGTGLSLAIYHLENSPAEKRAIVLITDGENNAGSIHPKTAAHLAKSKNISLYILGLGTKGVVPLDYVDPKTGRVYSGYLESNFDTASLSKLAQESDGKLFESDSLASLSLALASISKSESVVQSYHIKNNDTFYYAHFLAAAAFLTALAWVIRRLFLQEVL
ncbi:MAG: VWA domain-containing protein [Treponema sp.]|nr:VWA domain-containing protein [Candidatus Treponema equi]